MDIRRLHKNKQGTYKEGKRTLNCNDCRNLARSSASLACCLTASASSSAYTHSTNFTAHVIWSKTSGLTLVLVVLTNQSICFTYKLASYCQFQAQWWFMLQIHGVGILPEVKPTIMTRNDIWGGHKASCPPYDTEHLHTSSQFICHRAL